MHKLCSFLSVLMSSLSVGAACWAQTIELVRSPPPDLASYLLILESCELVSPGFKAATSSFHDRWRRENAAEIASVEASAKFKADLAELQRRVGTAAAKDMDEAKDMCGEMRHGLEVRPRDARLETPTKTWELFLTSLRSADRTTALGCLTGAARRKFRELLQSVPDSSLRQLGNDFAKFGITSVFGQGGSLQEGFAVTHDGRGHFIQFEERNGEWLIVDM